MANVFLLRLMNLISLFTY